MKRFRCAGEAALWGVIVLSAAILLLVIAYLSTAHAEEPKFNGYTCEDARRLVAELGKVRAFALAVENGLTLKQIWQIRRACKV